MKMRRRPLCEGPSLGRGQEADPGRRSKPGGGNLVVIRLYTRSQPSQCRCLRYLAGGCVRYLVEAKRYPRFDMVPLDPRDSDDLLEFVDKQERTSARPALSDQSRLALQHPGPDGPLV